MSGSGDKTLTSELLTPGDNDNQNQNQDGDFLKDLVGEGKKYGSVEEAAQQLAKKAKHADEFIETLKREKSIVLNELTEAKTKAQTAEELLILLKEGRGSNNGSAEQQGRTEAQSPTLTRDEIVAITRELLSSQESEMQRKAAFKKARDFLNSEDGFGSEDEAKKAIGEFLKRDPSNKLLVDTVGISNPSRLVQLVKMEVGSPENFSPEREQQFIPQGLRNASEISWDEAQKVKRENPARYRSAGFQKQLMNAMDKNPNFGPTTKK